MEYRDLGGKERVGGVEVWRVEGIKQKAHSYQSHMAYSYGLFAYPWDPQLLSSPSKYTIPSPTYAAAGTS